MKLFSKTLIVLTALILTTAVMAQDLENSVFGPTDTLREQAEQADAALLSPDTYLNGVKNLESAKSDFTKGKNLERVRKQLAKASRDFRKARENAELAQLALKEGIKSRKAAQLAEAGRLVAGEWIAAEKAFNTAALAFERGNMKAARKKHDAANNLFRTTELNAIRTHVQAEAWRLINTAEQKKVNEFAPQTLSKARQLIRRANNLIIKDRYTLDEPIDLAAHAVYEARHALFIADHARQIATEETSVEALILRWEDSLRSIAKAANTESDFSAGPRDTSTLIINKLEELPGLHEDLQSRDATIIDLENEIRELDAALGGISADRSTLIRRLEHQARVREQFRQVEQMFDSSEAVVLRDGDNLIVRLVGLSFASSSAELGPESEVLLARIQSAISVFPQCNLAIEGHTDAQGSAGKNLTLSEERAQAIKAYMTSVMLIPEFRIKASGYGDTRPIANNKTDAGRAKNRRIDLIITPGPESL